MMSLRLSLAALSLCVLGCNTEPPGPGHGMIAIDLLDADGSVTLTGLDSTSTEHVTLKAGESRLMRLPAGLYSVEFTPDLTGELGEVQLGSGPQVIVVAAERVTTLQIESELSDADARMASIEVW